MTQTISSEKNKSTICRLYNEKLSVKFNIKTSFDIDICRAMNHRTLITGPPERIWIMDFRTGRHYVFRIEGGKSEFYPS